MRGDEPWPGSVEDGIAYINPTCVGMNRLFLLMQIAPPINPTCVGMNRTAPTPEKNRASINPTCVGMNRGCQGNAHGEGY